MGLGCRGVLNQNEFGPGSRGSRAIPKRVLKLFSIKKQFISCLKMIFPQRVLKVLFVTQTDQYLTWLNLFFGRFELPEP